MKKSCFGREYIVWARIKPGKTLNLRLIKRDRLPKTSSKVSKGLQQVKLLLSVLKLNRFFSHQLNSKNNGPVSLFIRLYLGIETFSCRLLQQMAKVTWIESGTSWASFFKFLMLYLQESLKKHSQCRPLMKFVGTFFITLQDHFVHG